MQQSRLASLLLSVILHTGLFAAVLFWPAGTGPAVDLNLPVIDDMDIYTIGAPGRLTTQPPAAPKAPEAPPTVPPQAPEAPPTPEAPKPDPVQPPPDVEAVPIPQPEAPKVPPKPEPEQPKPVPEPPKPEPKAEPPKPAPPKPRPSPPRRRPEDVLKGLGKDRQPSSVDNVLKGLRNTDDADREGDGPGGEGGDGIGIRGTYMQSLVSRIKPNWEYAGRADRQNPTAVVEISIARDGTITDAVIVTPSGNAAFDGSVLKAVFDTIRVEPPPPSITKVRVPFAYEAIRR